MSTPEDKLEAMLLDIIGLMEALKGAAWARLLFLTVRATTLTVAGQAAAGTEGRFVSQPRGPRGPFRERK